MQRRAMNEFPSAFLHLCISVCLLAGAPAGAQSTAPAAKTRAHVQALAAPALEGRLAGSNGEKLASDYIVTELKKVGARPLPGRSDFLTPFAFTAGTKDGGSTIAIDAGGAANGAATRFNTQADVRALSFSDNAEITGDVVFAGYGIVVPESQNFGYDSYATLDVKDKIVLVLRYFPEDADQKTRGILARYADLRYKAMAARQRGARAMLVVTGPRSPNAGETIPMSFDTALAGSGIVAGEYQRQRRPRSARRAARGTGARGDSEIVRQRQSARRRLRGAGRTRDAARDGAARTAHCAQHPRLPAGDGAGSRSTGQTVDCGRRPLRPSGTVKPATRLPAKTI
jgi:hypothetical protein